MAETIDQGGAMAEPKGFTTWTSSRTTTFGSNGWNARPSGRRTS